MDTVLCPQREDNYLWVACWNRVAGENADPSEPSADRLSTPTRRACAEGGQNRIFTFWRRL